ncbi:Oidioi.mRNA.OKI2018_I69.chr1.g904.t1.cds [Oikopleura dioica]|uniref:Oidioi.mRNA.OKI2018_I69.chr1.g904.t1.cds n=1 Tax=Oikopleura dioica TaxID=34765 RepID=A0ABN7STH2_OIKDI|nr:Oidioi.mRNA.OKI2018_I69.chr1.g904.t1.cds [Oikopleura dioica]
MWAYIIWAHIQTILRIPILFWLDISGQFPGLFRKSPIQCYLELYRERIRNSTIPLPIRKEVPNFQVLNIETSGLEELEKYLGEITVLNFGSCT